MVNIMWARACLRMTLETKSLTIFQFNSLKAVIEQRPVSGPDIVRQ